MTMQLKLGSLFDGIGGFPLAASRFGITTVWCSEIEAAPISITKRHFPDMAHLGDIVQINGAEIEPVDIISFGSPCTNLSVAGRRAGFTVTFECFGDEKDELEEAHFTETIKAMDKTRYLYTMECPICGKKLEATNESALFFNAVRIIGEMRTTTDGRYPTFAIWENVPGAYSSNKGEDFRTVLEELAKIADGNVSIPRPAGGEWLSAGGIVGDGFSLAWRTMDAQYWGVPQRRKRIFLVADFAGERAGKILFERKGLLGDFTQGKETRQGITAAATPCARGTDYLTGWDSESKRVFTARGIAPTLAGSDGGGGRNPAGVILTK